MPDDNPLSHLGIPAVLPVAEEPEEQRPDPLVRMHFATDREKKRRKGVERARDQQRVIKKLDMVLREVMLSVDKKGLCRFERILLRASSHHDINVQLRALELTVRLLGVSATTRLMKRGMDDMATRENAVLGTAERLLFEIQKKHEDEMRKKLEAATTVEAEPGGNGNGNGHGEPVIDSEIVPGDGNGNGGDAA